MPFDVRVNMGLNLSVLPNCLLCLGSADMYVKLHERVVYRLRRRRLQQQQQQFIKVFPQQYMSLPTGSI